MAFLRAACPVAPRCVASGLVVLAIALYAVAVASGWMAGDEHGSVHWIEAIAIAVAVASLALRGLTLPGQRRIWVALAVGLTSYGTATLLWTAWLGGLEHPPHPSIADALWLAFYPMAAYALASLVRVRVGRLSRALMLDGLVAALGLAALAAAMLAPAVERASAGLETMALLTAYAYPVLDATLLAVVGFVFVVTGRRPGRAWTLLGLSLVSVTLADAVWSNQIVGLLGGSPGIPNLLWFTAWSIMTLAAWAPVGAPAPARARGRLATGVPVGFATVAIALLVFDHFQRVATVALALATASALLAMLRTVLTLAEERALAESRRQALTDDLTGLPNRRSLLGRMAEAIEGARAHDGTVGLLMIDLDRFKELNDTLGHVAGDELLSSLGPRLDGALGRDGRIARLGGDEFGVLLHAASPARAREIAERLRAVIEEPFELRGLRVTVGASIGAAIYPTDADTGEELMQRADVAMYQAKAAGTGIELYAAERDVHSRDRLVLAADLRHAIAEDRLALVYQPKAKVHTGAVESVEALVRWQHHSHGPVPPGQIVAIAEQTGLARGLTKRVLESAIRQASAWLVAGRPLRVSVNACSADLCDLAFADDVARLLARWRLPADLLQIEVTESTLLGDPAAAHAVLGRLRELGVESSLDDFGTGHSSLTHLRRLPVSELKLDRSFVAGMVSDHQDASIVRSVIDLAGQLGLRVVAEGVEDDSTWSLLHDLGCDEIQGYLLSRPLAAAALEEWLNERERLNEDRVPVQAR